MKKLIIILLVLCLMVSGCLLPTNEKTEITAKPLPRLIDELIVIPDTQQHLYGNSERTRILINLIVLKEVCAKYEKEIQKLQANIMLLKNKEKENE